MGPFRKHGGKAERVVRIVYIWDRLGEKIKGHPCPAFLKLLWNHQYSAQAIFLGHSHHFTGIPSVGCVRKLWSSIWWHRWWHCHGWRPARRHGRWCGRLWGGHRSWRRKCDLLLLLILWSNFIEVIRLIVLHSPTWAKSSAKHMPEGQSTIFQVCKDL